MNRIMRVAVLAVVLVGLLAQAQNRAFTSRKNRAMLESMAKSLEVKAQAEEPSWARRPDAPTLTVAWLTDTHIGVTKGALERTRVLLNQLRDEMHPDLTLMTGDNNAQSAGLPHQYDKLSASHRNQLWLKQFLDTELARPYAVIPGDNWPWDFEKVFGSPTRSFTCRGFHFLLTATDAKATGNDACAVLFDDTKRWLRKDLSRHASQPCLVVMHETVFPPLFLDADWLANLVASTPQALALLSGHLHYDLDITRNGCRNIMAPAVGPSTPPAFKLLRCYPDLIVILTYEWDGSQFRQARKWQRLDIPERLRAAVVAAAGRPAVLEELRTMPVRPKQRDQELLKRAPEIDQRLMTFFLQFGASRLLLP